MRRRCRYPLVLPVLRRGASFFLSQTDAHMAVARQISGEAANEVMPPATVAVRFDLIFWRTLPSAPISFSFRSAKTLSRMSSPRGSSSVKSAKDFSVATTACWSRTSCNGNACGPSGYRRSADRTGVILWRSVRSVRCRCLGHRRSAI